MSARYASDRLPWRRLAIIAALAAALLAVSLTATWIFYETLGAPSRRALTTRFSAPALNTADDRTRAWRLSEPASPHLRAAIAQSMNRLAARGDAAYDASAP